MTRCMLARYSLNAFRPRSVSWIMVWGLFPILLAGQDFNLEQIGKIVALYPIVWGLGQLLAGKLADHLNKKKMFGLKL